MIDNKTYRFLLWLSVSLLIMLWIISPAHAATEQNKKFGSWLMHCSEIETPQNASANSTEVPTQEVCALFQSVAAENRPRFGLTVLISKDDGSGAITPQNGKKNAALIKILVPLGVLLPTGVGMDIDGENLGLTGFLRCLPNGCTAVATLSDESLARLKSATTASFTVFLTPEDGLAIPIRLNGLAEGFDALD
ncbi:MAG: invasion associated locus B family protein [Alphaproteobacteria bacterium]|nr:invasion associated locus B family protein [Alphaproteobacteria bacterium]